METLAVVQFDQPDLRRVIDALVPGELDDLQFGVIGFDRDTTVQVYNDHETEAAGLGRGRVVGRPFFSEVAPCMNNYLVAQRFKDAHASSAALDETIDYVLTLRMRPTRVKLRLLSSPDSPLSYVLVLRT